MNLTAIKNVQLSYRLQSRKTFLSLSLFREIRLFEGDPFASGHMIDLRQGVFIFMFFNKTMCTKWSKYDRRTQREKQHW